MRRLTCPLCRKQTPTYQAMLRHAERAHPGKALKIATYAAGAAATGKEE